MLKHLQSSEDWNEKSIGAKGFTLIELLVVIVILGILAAVVVFAVGGIQDRGQKSACQTEARTVRTAKEAQFANASGTPTYAGSLASLVTDGYLSKAPTLVSQSSASSTSYSLAWAGDCVGVSGLAATP